MAQNKTQPSNDDVAAFLNSVTPERRQQDALRLDQIFREITGFAPKLWGPSIIGYGSYHYTYATGRQGDWLATGFSPRKAALSVYIMPGYADFGEILARLGKHKMGKSCLYINKLTDVNETALRDLIRAGLQDLAKKWPVRPS